MAFNGNLVPWRWGKRNIPLKREQAWPSYPSASDEMSRLFEEFFHQTPGWPSLAEQGTGVFQPRIDLTETERELKVSAELPGLSEKDIDLSLSNEVLTIKGEKNEEKEDRTHGYYRVERYYGSFQRTIPLPCEVDSDKVEASFKSGVLTVTLPKSAKAQESVKKISIKQG